MWTARLSADEGDRYRTGRPRPAHPRRRRRGPHPVVRRLRILLLGTSGAQRVSGPWPAQAMWQVCGITAMPSGRFRAPAAARAAGSCVDTLPLPERGADGGGKRARRRALTRGHEPYVEVGAGSSLRALGRPVAVLEQLLGVQP